MEMVRAAVLSGHAGSVYALACNGTSTVFSGGGDRIVAEWDLNDPNEGHLLAKVNDIVYSILPLPDQRILIGQASGGIHVIHLGSRKEERLLQYHKSGVFRMAHAPQNGLLVSLSGDGEMAILDDHELAIERILNLGGGVS